MVIDIEKEKLLPVKEARKLFPLRPSLSTVFRWLNKGVRGVRLESVRIGGRRYTSAEAIERFILSQQQERCTPKSNGHENSITDAKRLLDAFGI